MTFSLQQFKAYGIRSDKTRQHAWQVAELGIVAANTDTALDISSDTNGSLGTFWTAAIANGTYGTLASNALASIQAIVANINSLKTVSSEALLAKQPADSAGLVSFLSSASLGGAAAEAYTVTGLLSTDTILSVTPKIASATGRAAISVLAGTVPSGAATGNATVTGLLGTDTVLAVTQNAKGANSLPLLGYGAPASNAIPFVYSADPGASGTINVLISRAATTDTYNPVSYGSPGTDALTVTYGADPGAGAKVEVLVSRTAGTLVPVAGQYHMAVTGHLPSITFASGDAPTSQVLRLVWTLQDGMEAVFADYGAAF
jgi:hypothetical protein